MTILFMLLLSTEVAWAKKLKVAVFFPRYVDDVFYSPMAQLMKKAAHDFKIELKTYHFGNDFTKLIENVQMAIDNKSDALILMNFKNTIASTMRMAEEAKIPYFIINARPIGLGGPRERFPHWIGEMFPDDVDSGAQLIKLLHSRGKKKFGSIKLLAFNGNKKDPASIDRNKGLISYVRKNKIRLFQDVEAFWMREIAAEKFHFLKIRRFPDTNVVWSASDEMALGVIEKAKTMGLRPGKDFITGGFDISKNGLMAIERGEMEASLGGHFYEGAWALTLVHDYLMGNDFQEHGTVYKTKLTLCTQKNLKACKRLASPEFWRKINFRSLSHHYNPLLKNYHFHTIY